MNNKLKLFQSASAALWGPQYCSEAARRLGVSLRAAQRYDAGEREVPAVLIDRLQKLLRERQGEIAKLLPKLDTALAAHAKADEGRS